MRTVVAWFPALIVVVFCQCGIAPDAGGGTTDTGNARVAAVMHTQGGGRAAGAEVTVCRAGYVAATGASGDVKTVRTDDTGYFRIDTIDAGAYSIEVNDGNSTAVLLSVTVPSDTDSTVVVSDTLRPYAAVEGHVGASSDSAVGRYVVVFGLDRRVPVENDGSFLLDDIPAGTFHLRVVSETSAFTPIDFDTVSVQASKKATVAVADTAPAVYRATVILNTASNGAAVAADVYGFPVLVRLTEDNFYFGRARGDGGDVRFVKNNGMLLPFEIESWDTSGHRACIWVRIDTIFGNNATQSFVMKWGGTDTAARASGAVFDTTRGFFAGYHLCGTLDDATGHGYDGIDNGSVDAANGIIGKARSFNGSSQFFSIGDLPDRVRGTISCWIRPNVSINSSTSKTQGIWGKKETDGTNYSLSLGGSDFYISATADARGRLVTKQEVSDSGYFLVSATAAFNAGTWYFVSWSWGDGGDSLYVNGILESSTAHSLTLGGTGIEEIGRNNYDSQNISGGGPLYFNGTLDEFRIDNACRSAAWVRLCYMNQRTDDKLVRVE